MKFGVIISARIGSVRLPSKALLPLTGIPMINFLIKRIKNSKLASEIIFATTYLPEDDRLAESVKKEGVYVYRGNSEDVLARYVNAAKNRDFDYSVRVTGDCPFVDGETLDYVLSRCLKLNKFDLVTTKPKFPHGIDYEVYPSGLLEEINKNDEVTSEDREHMLNYIYRNERKYSITRLSPPLGLELDKTIFLVDTIDDYNKAKKLLEGIDNVNIRVSDLIEKYKK